MLFKGPSDVAVEEVHAILRHIVARSLEAEECKALAQYGQLKREIATCAAAALESMKVRLSVSNSPPFSTSLSQKLVRVPHSPHQAGWLVLVDVEIESISVEVELVLSSRLGQDLCDAASIFNATQLDI